MAAAAEVAALSGGEVAGADNREACSAAGIVVLATPFGGLEETVALHAGVLAGKLVVSAVIPLQVVDGRFGTIPIVEGSAAELVAARLPQSRVAAAFHNISYKLLMDLDHSLDEDVPVAADAENDRDLVLGLCRDIGARGVAVGPLSLARYLEGYTAVLLTVNKLHRTQAGIRFTGLP
jgi:NADPH-dependent F420 reductase